MASTNSAFLQETANDVGGKTGSRLHLALFGKHPAWNDHMEDIGLATPSLAMVKDMLYLQGVRMLIEKDMPPVEDTEGVEEARHFGHQFLWLGPRGFVLGRMWDSKDGKGRASYPMVAAAHFLTADLPVGLDMFFEVFEQLQKRCESATAQADVVLAHSEARQDMLALSQRGTSARIAGPGADARRLFLEQTMTDNPDGFARLLFAMKMRVKPHSIAGDTKRDDHPPAVHFRIPEGPRQTGYAMLLWIWFLQPHLAPATPLLLCLPFDKPRLDVVIGMPVAEDFAFLHGGLKAIPRTTDVPFTISDEDRLTFTEWCEGFEMAPFETPGLWGKAAEAVKSGLLQRLKSQLGLNKT